MTIPKYLLLSLMLLLLGPWMRSGGAQALSVLTGENLTRARSGPAYSFPVVAELLPGTEVALLGQNSDQSWLLVGAADGPVWIPTSALGQAPEEALPMQKSEPAPPLPAENCISVVGDSVAYGTTVYEVPGQGFAILRLAPLSEVLQPALIKRGLGHVQVRDRSASAAFLSDRGKNPYREMPEFAALLADECRFTLLMPWINDLSVEGPAPAADHMRDLIRLVGELDSPHLLLLGFYDGQPSEFARQHAPGYNTPNLALFEAAWQASCADTQAGLGQFPQVTCQPIADIFAEADQAHVALGINQEDLLGLLYEPIPADVAPFFEVYWRDNPGGLVFGDGVHLSQAGKNTLVQVIIEALLALEPDL